MIERHKTFFGCPSVMAGRHRIMSGSFEPKAKIETSRNNEKKTYAVSDSF